MATITKGTYLFNLSLTHLAFNVDINFASNKGRLSSTGFVSSVVGTNMTLQYKPLTFYVYNTNTTGWTNTSEEGTRLIEITEDTSVVDAFYTWFTANTTKQESSAAKMYVGSKAVNKMYVGSKEVKKAYMGGKLVYEQKSSSGETKQ